MEHNEDLYLMQEKDVFGIESNIAIFITKPLTWAELEERWKEIRNMIAGNQRFLDDEFERWNHYLFYRVDGGANNNIELKHKIEHDTISSRKVVVSAEEYKENDFDTIISKYISYNIEMKIAENLPKFKKSESVAEMMEKDWE